MKSTWRRLPCGAFFTVLALLISAAVAAAERPVGMKMGPPPPGDPHIVGEPVPDWQWRGRQRRASLWEAMGPKPILNEYWSGNDDASGRVVSLAHHPQNAAVAYLASASGGIWKTVDAGANWAPLTDELSILNHGCVTLDPTTPENVYAGTGEYTTGSSGDGIFYSSDGGVNWVKLVDDAVVGVGCSGLIVDPTTPARLHYSGRSGYYRSTDGGQNWTQEIPGRVSSITINTTDPNLLYAGKHDVGIYKSVDAGDSWTLLAGGLPTDNISRVLVAVAPSQPDTIYAALLNGGSLLGLYRSDNAGATWSIKPNTPNFPYPQGAYDAFIAVDPGNADRLYAGGVFPTYAVAGVIRSVNGGDSWTDVTFGNNGVQLHPDMHVAGFDANGHLWVGNDGGVWRSEDQGTNWINLNAGLTLTQNYQIAVKPDNPQIVLGGTQDNGTVGRTLETNQWPQLIGGDGGFLTYDFDNPTIRYTTYVYLAVYRFIGGSVSNISGPWDGDQTNFIAPLVMDPNDASTLVGGTDRVWRTTNADSGASWSPISDQMVVGGTAIAALAVAHGASDTLFVSGNSGQFAVTTNGATWVDRSAGLPSYSASDIIPDPQDPLTLWVSLYSATGGRIFYSGNLGATWQSVTGSLPVGVTPRALEVIYRGGQPMLLIGSGSGFWWSKDLGASWIKDDQSLPNVNVGDLRFDSQQAFIYVGTYGRGVWRASLNRLLGGEEVFVDSFESP